MPTKKCEGSGECLWQCGCNGKDYYRGYSCLHKCELKKCPNYDICKNKQPQWVLWTSGNRCFNCDVTFGMDLQKDNSDKKECPVCMENDYLYSLNCQHEFCSNCIRKIYLSYDSEESIFYENRKDIPILSDDDEENEETEEDDESDYNEDKPISIKCPICRKEWNTR